MKVISIDPGRTTGYCYAKLDPGGMIYRPFQEMDEVEDLWKRLLAYSPLYVIIEDFESRRGTAGSGHLDMFPQQLIGITRLYGNTFPPALVFVQKAAQAKGYYTDPMLKRLGLYKRGLPHGMDASRHLLHWLTFGFGYQFLGKNEIPDFVTMTEGGDRVDN